MHIELHPLPITPLGKSKDCKSVTTLLVEDTQPRTIKKVHVPAGLTHKSKNTFNPFIADYLRPRTKPLSAQTHSSLKLKSKLQKMLLPEIHSVSSQKKKKLDEKKLLEKFSLWLQVAQARCPGDIQYMLEQLLEGLAKHTHTPHTLQMLDASNKTQLSRLTLTLYEHGIKSLRRQQNSKSSTQIVPKGHNLCRLWRNLISTKNVFK